MSEHAVKAIAPPHAEVTVPGCAGLAQRALVCVSLAEGTSRIADLKVDADTTVLIDGLTRLGVEITQEGGEHVIKGSGGRLAIPLHPIDCGTSSSAMRWLTACAALVPGRVVLDGTPRMRERSIQELADAVAAMGARATTVAGHAPITVMGGDVAGGAIGLDAHRSGEFLSALLLIAPLAQATVEITSGQLASRIEVDMTLDVMNAFGIVIARQGGRFRTEAGQHYRARSYRVEPDAVEACHFFGAAALTGGKIRVNGLTPASCQVEARFVEVLERMGCGVERGARWLTVRGPRYMHGIDVDMRELSRTVPILAVVACFAKGATTIRGIGEPVQALLGPLARELEKLGAAVTSGDDFIRITPPAEPKPSRFRCDGAAPLAAALALAGLRVPGIVIEDPECLAEASPEFLKRLARL
jgi:3-phosphoshikimate 1-carboxyvinyltransferase